MSHYFAHSINIIYIFGLKLHFKDQDLKFTIIPKASSSLIRDIFSKDIYKTNHLIN